ncbi:MAG: VWA domain-containing protein [Candidatus Lokiarchaeota archaeon]|nr:VWA domain-containing protein [Candidatus Lokiarchaeota archaeon]MBD3342696.1 VWA domain-containing protein [Candidatus Lokiarchaeota archaeon]
MGVFPENPCEFAVEFIRKMRKHPDIVQIPSSRQVLSIPRLILARFYRKGVITPNDYIDVSTVTSYPSNQELAKKISFELLFPNYKKDLMDSFFEEGKEHQQDYLADELLSEGEQEELDDIQELIDEIEMSSSIDTDFLEKIEKFVEELNQKRNEEPFKSAMNFFPDEADLYKERVTSLEELIEKARERMEQMINSLDPNDLKAGNNLDMNELIQKKSRRQWENITSKALNNQDISKDLEDLMNSQNLEDLIQTSKYLKETNAASEDQLNQLQKAIENQIKNLDQLFQASKNLGNVPDFNPEELLKNSLNQSSFEHNFNLANSLDQYFGTNLRSQLLDQLSQNSQNLDMNLSLESLADSAYANKSWNQLFNQALQNAIKNAMNKQKKSEEFKNLSHQLQQLSNSCPNMHCSQKMNQKIPDVVKKSLESCETPSQLKDVTEFLRKIGLDPQSQDIEDMGKKLGMSEDEIYELIEPNYQLLKKLIDKSVSDFERISNLMNQIKDQLNKDRIKELTASALASDNRDALGALGHFDLDTALNSAQQIGGEEAQDKMIQCLGAGSGENLLKQWYIHRKHLPATAKSKVKELAKKMLIELGIFYSRARLGSSTTGPMPINIVRPYAIGDDFENIDLEETINNILEKGKKLDHINYDDFYVYETAKGMRSACFELDISGSMSGDKLAYMAICVTMLCYGMRKDEIAVTFFESDTHVLKEMDEKIDMEKLADELLTVTARGGTRVQRALEWARRQFKEKSSSREKLNVLFTDAEIYDLREAVEKLRIFRSMGVDFILVVPETSFNLKDAERIVKIAGGQLLTIKNWNEFPELISDIIKSKF